MTDKPPTNAVLGDGRKAAPDPPDGGDGKALEGDVLPAQMQERIAEFMAMSVQAGPVPHPLIQKMKPEHIDKVLQNADEHDKRILEDRKDRRGHAKTFFFGGLVFVLIVIFGLFWLGKDQYVQTIIAALLGFLGGMGARPTFDRVLGA